MGVITAPPLHVAVKGSVCCLWGRPPQQAGLDSGLAAAGLPVGLGRVPLA